MKRLELILSDDEYDMLQRVANKRKCSIRALVLRMFYEVDYRQQKRKHGAYRKK